MKARQTAYHEAGHAVVAYLERVAVTGVSIVPDGDSHGRMRHSNPLAGEQLDVKTTTSSRWRMENLVRVCLAGREAQRRFNPRSWRHHRGAADHDTAVDLLSYFTGSNEETEAYLRLLLIQTRQKLMRPGSWEAVEAVASALLKEEELSGRRVRAIIRKTIFPSFP